MYCLPPQLAKLFLEKLKSGEISPDKLTEMSSEERRAIFSEFAGETSAHQINTLLESKLLLKNQQQGIVSWAKQVSGMKPEVMRDILARVERMDRVLNPKDLNSFLEDLAAHRLGMTVSLEEAAKISELAKKTAEAKTARDNGGDRIAYGDAKVAFHNYVNELKQAAGAMTFAEVKANPLGSAAKAAAEVPGLAKSVKASLDVSALGRQGWKTIWTHPTTWLRNAQQTFVDVVKTFGGKEVMDEVNADIVSRDNADLYKKAKLAVGTVEESFPTKIQEKLPLIGKAFKASDVAYTAFIHRMRADVFDQYIDIAKKSGVDITDKAQLESIGRLVNSLTGRGALGKLEPAAGIVNNVFFSPRNLKANFDTLTAHTFEGTFNGERPSDFVRKQAAINLMKIAGGTAAVLALANAIWPGSVEKDPRSSDFGKIKIGNTRFDVTGGMASLITLAARLATMSSKSSTTGRINKLNSGAFGSQTGWDVLLNFTENKLSPAAAVLKDVIKGQDFNGNKPTLGGEAKNLFAPLAYTNWEELQKDPNSANTLVAMIADGLGIATNTYSPNTDWSVNTGVELQQFKSKIGDHKFKEANDKYNEEYAAWLEKVKKDDNYNKLSSDEQGSVISKKKAEIKANIFHQYGFKYKKPLGKKLPKF